MTTNTWIVAGTSIFEPYPCRCELWREGGCNPAWCPCSGRPLAATLPRTCCAWVNRPAVAAQARAEKDTWRR